MNPAETKKSTWPLLPICVVFFPFLVFWLGLEPSLANSRSAFTEPISLGVFAIFWLRVLIAKVRKEGGRDWIVYLVGVCAIPLAAEFYAQHFIPMVFVHTP